ncbi:small G protein signaling modulator 1-like isoform X1 [Canna indica]|uniref:Small G protein signaling modulator 1-like isoform X1 n=1 Tax=Canna indica TaxID=4628 RepID=A0AAQ3KT14_9LILI|nr:small G protein signaling modulator 1-like isoform X1 [Canna indica]
MSVDGEDTRWMCGRASMVNLHRVGSIVKEIGEPCLYPSPAKRNKMLKPEKWHAVFDGDGKVIGFRKALKLIVLGGVDPSIRAEVWEFLLGCYNLGSTAEYRRQLRMARRERYEDLIKQCRTMHSSVGTGKLAYVVGSKVMDARTLSKDNGSGKAVISGYASHDPTNKQDAYSDMDNDYTDYSWQKKSSGTSTELVSARMSTDSAACNFCSRASECEINELQYDTESYYDFPPLPVTNLFKRSIGDESESKKHEKHDDRTSVSERTSQLKDGHMYSFQINNNEDLIMESDIPSTSNDESEIFHSNVPKCVEGTKEMVSEKDVVNGLRISDIPEASMTDQAPTNSLVINENRVSEWLWTLHRIVVDVVRTDNHLEFYGDSKNMARMSDILAVYAWVDPATGYCQGMSDLLSPFVVLYEDDADAFWCFEMLLRRMRENFQMEGPTGVMKQLQTLWKILELIDIEMFGHLSVIGAESLHFAFRMLLVLFRRELTFDEALRMWEMMWAADFDEAICQKLEENCLEPLVLPLKSNLSGEIRSNESGNVKRKLKMIRSGRRNGESLAQQSDGARPISVHPLCGLSSANCWIENEQMQRHSLSVSRNNSDDELPVFCVAAILIINRQKILRETHSFDDVIKMFNDNMLKINVKRCIRLAIKLRKKYFYKLIKITSLGSSV